MTNAARELLERALLLNPNERIRLARDLLESVESDDVGEFSAEWIAEIEERVDRVVAGDAGPDEDWRAVLDRIRGRGADRSA
jgi:Putative addiction module component